MLAKDNFDGGVLIVGRTGDFGREVVKVASLMT